MRRENVSRKVLRRLETSLLRRISSTVARSVYAGMLLLGLLCRVSAAVSPDELRQRIKDWPYLDWPAFPNDLTVVGTVELSDLAALITPGIPQDWQFLEKILLVLQKIGKGDVAALAKARQLVETLEQFTLTERIEALATGYYLAYAPRDEAGEFVRRSMSILRPRALVITMEWIAVAAGTGENRERSLQLGHRALQRFKVLAETQRFHAEALEFSPAMMFKLSSLFGHSQTGERPFFGQEAFEEDWAEALMRALAHPGQFNHWGVDTLLGSLGLMENRAVLFRAFQQRIAASTLPQQRMLLYFLFRENWQQLEETKKLIEWVKGYNPEMARLIDDLAASKLVDGKVVGPASEAIEEACRELGIETLS